MYLLNIFIKIKLQQLAIQKRTNEPLYSTDLILKQTDTNKIKCFTTGKIYPRNIIEFLTRLHYCYANNYYPQINSKCNLPYSLQTKYIVNSEMPYSKYVKIFTLHSHYRIYKNLNILKIDFGCTFKLHSLVSNNLHLLLMTITTQYDGEIYKYEIKITIL